MPATFPAIASISGGTTIATGPEVVFSNGNGVSFGVSGQTVTASVAPLAANVGFGISSGGNTSGTSGTTKGTLVLAGIGNITLSQATNPSGGTVTISGSQSTAPAALSAGTTLVSNGTVVFANSNGVSFGLNGSTITASVAPSAASVNFSAGTTSNNLGSVVFGNSNGVSFGLNGSTITGSIASSLTAINLSAGTTSNNLSALTLSNSNNVSFGLSGSVVTASATVASSQGSINLSAGTTSNLGSAFTFSNGSNVSFGLNGSVITASVAASLTAINVSAGTTSNNLSAITLSNSNGVSFGLNGSVITASVSVAAGQASVSFFEAYPAVGVQANTFSNAVLSFGRIPVPMPINATELMALHHYSCSTGAVGGATLTYSAAVYTLSGSTAGLVSSATQSLAFNLSSATSATGQYGGQSGTRYRPMSIGTWNLTPGDYLFAYGMSLDTAGTSLSVSHWCRPQVSINPMAGGGNLTNLFAHGVYSATTNALPASVQIADINFTGSGVQRVPWFMLAG